MSGGRQFDVAIIGGGLVGSAIAFGLRALGHRLAILDEGDVAGRAARGSFGLIWVQGVGTGFPGYATLVQRSRREWARFAVEVESASGVDVELSLRGGVHLCLGREEFERRVARLEGFLSLPDVDSYPLECMDRRALAHLLPGVGPEVHGGTWCPLDGQCNPLQLFRGLHLALRRAGCVMRPGSPVQRITARHGGFDLTTPAGLVTADRVVIASGMASTRLAPMVGIAAPLRPQRCQTASLERMRPLFSVPTSTLRQSADGTVFIGNTLEDDATDDRETLAVQAALASRALRAFPMLRDCHVTHTWAGLRVSSPDGAPIYQQSVAQPGAFLASCRDGVALAALHAQVLAPAVIAGSIPASLAHFSTERFDVPQAA
jgi:hydrogen cyanide synthase HcnC